MNGILHGWQTITYYIRDVPVAHHCYPLNDERSHERYNCWCNPRLDDDRLPDFWIHHAADHRETLETYMDIPQ